MLVLLKEKLRSLGILNTKLLVAVSGGLDSVVLLHLLSELRRELSLQLAVGHVDHGLRERSAKDAQFVSELARAWQLECFVERLANLPPGENLEAWARRNRYEALERFRVKSDSQWIVTAHHRGDLVETLLFRAHTNRLLTSLATIDFKDERRRLLRPLLDFDKSELHQLANEQSLTWVEDESNVDLRRTRNWIRHSILPQLVGQAGEPLQSTSTCSPQSVRAETGPGSIVALSAAVAHELNHLEKKLRGWAEQIVTHGIEEGIIRLRFGLFIECERALLTALPLLLRLRVLNELVKHIPHLGGIIGHAELLGESALHGVDKLLSGACPRINLGHGVFGESRGTSLQLGAKLIPSTDDERIQLLGSSKELPSGGEAEGIVKAWSVGGELVGEFTVKLLGPRLPTAPSEQVESIRIPTTLLRYPVTVRGRRAGDVIRVRGRGGRKVKKLFQEQGLMLTLRDAIPIVEADDQIVWIPGVAKSDLCVEDLLHFGINDDRIRKGFLDSEHGYSGPECAGSHDTGPRYAGPRCSGPRCSGAMVEICFRSF